MTELYEEQRDFLEEQRTKIGMRILTSHGVIISEEEGVQKKCPCCSRSGLVARRRLNTQYAEEEQNWMTACLECHDETIAHYNDMWSDYYRDCR